jgi:hypothetical protein
MAIIARAAAVPCPIARAVFHNTLGISYKFLLLYKTKKEIK